MNPLISVCMPNYNYEKFIGESIESVLNQDYENFELIISDNASTDNSIDVIKSFKDKRIKLLQSNENIPLYRNVEKAVSHSVGELICILHSDDIYKKNYFDVLAEHHLKYPDKQIFVSGVKNFYSGTKSYEDVIPFDTHGVISSAEAHCRLLVRNVIGNGVNVALRRSIVNMEGLYSSNYKYSADYELWCRLSKKYDLVSIPEVLTAYRLHSSNLTHTVLKNADMFDEGVRISAKYLADMTHLSQEKINILGESIVTDYTYKALYLGSKYSSTNTTVKMLDIISKNFDISRVQLLVGIAYFLSRFTETILGRVVLKLAAAAWAPEKKLCNRNFEKMLSQLSAVKHLKSHAS